MDSRAAIAALIGVAIGTAIAVCVSDRRWRDASSISALGTALILGIVTEGNHSHSEHNVVFAVELLLLACFVYAAGTGRRRHRK